MDRRNFLKGTFGGVAAGGIVIAAGLPDTQAFVEQVKIGDPVAATISPPGFVDVGEMVFNHKGDPIGVITRWESRRHMEDVTGWNDSARVYLPGAIHITFEVTAVGPVRWNLNAGR